MDYPENVKSYLELNFESLDSWLTAKATSLESEGDDIENKLPSFLDEYGGVGDIFNIPITAHVWNFVGYPFELESDAVTYMLGSFIGSGGGTELADGTMVQGPTEASGTISTITYNSVVGEWDGSLNLLPGRGYRVYFQEDGQFAWNTELELDNVCSDSEAYNFYEWCDEEAVDCDAEANAECCIVVEGDSNPSGYLEINDVRFCGDETALNYNPDLEEFLANGCSYFGQCFYENGHDVGSRLNGYYINELKFILDFVELNNLMYRFYSSRR